MEQGIIVTFGAGICSSTDSSNCLIFDYIVENVIIPIPTRFSDGSISWPTGNVLI